MTYLRTHNRPARTRTRIIVIACGILVVIGGAIRLWVPYLLPGIFNTIAVPFWRAEFSSASGSLDSPGAMLAQNEDLRRQLADAQVRLQTIQGIESENADLKALMGRASTTPYILGAVLSRPPFTAYDELIIDAGRDRGISSSSLVYAPGNVAIGRVTEVFADTSRVMLFSSPDETYQVLIGPSHIAALATGRGGGQYQAELSREAKVSEGDAVNSSGLNDRPFGVVTSVLSDPAQPFQTVLFAPPVNVYQLRWVLVDAKNIQESTAVVKEPAVKAKK